jgi:hypothetical protein
MLRENSRSEYAAAVWTDDAKGFEVRCAGARFAPREKWA